MQTKREQGRHLLTCEKAQDTQKLNGTKKNIFNGIRYNSQRG